ncbi:collagen alpha-3(VI) chain-like [Haliotis asinina]|uniref:collagen alpha-3(VI) chain-like n=1 Tax=Haliotis asinina TaxID=109174 RepID=UPI003532028C
MFLAELAMATLMVSFVSSRPSVIDCGGKAADIVFVVDTSRSIWPPDFNRHVLPFVSDVVGMFDVGPGEKQTRVGMITFGNTYHHQFHLKDYQDKESVTKKILNTPFRGGNTKTDAALDYVRNVMFAPENGAREGVTHIAVVLTDGESDNTELTNVAASLAKKAGIQIFAIGVGHRVVYSELRNIASEPDSQYMFHVGNFRALDSIKDNLAIRTCAATTKAPSTTERLTTPITTTTTTTTTTPSTTTTTTTTTTTKPSTTSTAPTTTAEPTTGTTTTTTIRASPYTFPPRTPAKIGAATTSAPQTSTTERLSGDEGRPDTDVEPDDCKSKPADIYFILDVSASLYIKHFNEKVIPFVYDAVKDFDISPTHTRVGLVTFADNVTSVFGLDTYKTKDELQKAISANNIVYTGGLYTNTADAIAHVREVGFARNVARKGVTKMAVVVTDGMSFDPLLTAKEAKLTKDSGIFMFAIGVGPSINPAEMKVIASHPEEQFVFHVTHFDALAGVTDILKEKTCRLKGANTIVFDPENCVIDPTDIMFVFESASKLPSSRSIMRTVITNFAEKLKVKAEQVRVGSLTDPCPAEEDLSFISLEAFKQKVNTIVHNTEGEMHRLISTLRTEEFKEKSARRQVAVLFLDENTRKAGLVVRQAMKLKKEGVEVYVVAVGDVSEYMVTGSASELLIDHVIRLQSYPHLKSVKLNKLWNICAGNIQERSFCERGCRQSIYKMFLAKSVFAFILTMSGVSSSPYKAGCRGKGVDIVFIVDASTSIWPPDFHSRVLPFVSNVIKLFDVGPGEKQTRVGMITFGNTYHHQFHLKDYQDKESLTKKILNTPFRGGNTKVNEALDYVRKVMFAPENGARDSASDIAVILTDGESDNTELTKVSASLAKKAGIQIFAIGVGHRVVYSELRNIASEPDSLFHVGSFRALDSIKEILARRTCAVAIQTRHTTTVSTSEPAITPTTEPSTYQPVSPTSFSLPPKTPPATEESSNGRFIGDESHIDSVKNGCKTIPADIYFILDVSASLYIKHFQGKVIPFVYDAVKDFDINPTHTRVGLVTFATNVTSVFGLEGCATHDELQKAISANNIVYTGGRRTNTADAIAYVREVGFARNVARKGVTKIAVVVTDGMSYDPLLTAKEAKLTKDSGIFMFAIGPSFDPVEMKAIGSHPEERFVFHVNTLEALDRMTDILKEEMCRLKGANTIIFDPENCAIGSTDIMFVFESASKLPSSRSIMRTVITNFAEKLKVKAEQVRVGSLTDPCPDEEDIFSLEAFMQKVNTIVQNTEGEMHRLINILKIVRFNEKATSVRRQVAVLFLDEHTRSGALVVRQARELKKEGVEVYVVAIGDVSEYIVTGSASELLIDHVIRLQSYPHLKSVKLNKLWNICADDLKAGDMMSISAHILILAVGFGAVQCHLSLKTCSGKAADVVFVLDTSTSIWVSDFNQYVRPFVRDVVRMFDVGAAPSQTRVGVVTYSDEYHPQFDLGTYLTRDSLEQAIENIVFTGGSTFTSKALHYVADDMFRLKNGARSEATSVIILVTDGRSRFPTVTRVEADRARVKGAHIFAIGVGEDVDESELRAISDNPDSMFMFHVKDYMALHGIKRHLAIRTCEVIPTVPVPTDGPQNDIDPEAIKYCGGKPADVFFLLDVSSSVWIKNFRTKVLPFVRDMVSIFDIGSTKTRIGLVTFSNKTTPIFSLNHFNNREQLKQALNPERVRYTGGQTYTSSALAYVRDYGFAPNIARPGVAQVIILVTDGISYDPALTAAEAEKAKKKGMYIFAIGVGPSIDYKELRDVSSDPDERFVFTVTNFAALSSIRNILAIQTCRVEPTQPPPADISICNIDSSDIYFVFESDPKTIEERKQFRSNVIKLVKNTFSSNRGIRISAITDPCIGDRDIPFTTLLDFKFRFGSTPVPPKTKMHDLINKLKDQAVETHRRTRRSRQVGVIFLDEKTTNLMDVVMEARRAQDMGVELYVVAIGSLQSRIIDMIGSSPARDHVVMFESYDDLHTLNDVLGKKMC